jgi:PD-(D/E)XK endonuclease
MDDPNKKGNIAETAIALHAVWAGIPVCRPLHEHGRYDLVMEIDGRLWRVQCKWANRVGDVIPVRFTTHRRGPKGFVRRRYTEEEIDAVAAYCPDLDESYFLPMAEVGERTGLQLRLTAPKNGQRAALHFAAEYRLGAVAQLGRALPWHGRGRGFESHQLHSLDTGAEPVTDAESVEVGAHEFRNHFGWYMQRATAGETFLVKRRGKPYVKLSPAAEPLTVVPFPKKRLAAG